jgi:hypothetical protein
MTTIFGGRGSKQRKSLKTGQKEIFDLAADEDTIARNAGVNMTTL